MITADHSRLSYFIAASLQIITITKAAKIHAFSIQFNFYESSFDLIYADSVVSGSTFSVKHKMLF